MIAKEQITVENELTLRPRFCPLCGDAPFKVIGKGYDYTLRITLHIFEYRRCEKCATIYLDFEPVQLDKVYKEHFWNDKKRIIYNRLLKKQLLFKHARLNKRLSVLAQKKPNFKLLDIGSGRGDLFIILKEKFPKGVFYSIDLTEEVIYPGVTHHKGYFEDYDFGDEKFDVITSQHNIEHVYSPIDYLRKASSLLNDSGFIFTVTPNADAPEFNFFKKNLYCGGYDIPRHLSLFNEDSFQTMVAKLEELQIESINYFFTIFHWVSLIHHFAYDKCKNKKVDDWINYNNILISFPFYLFELIRYWLRFKTGVLEIILRKNSEL